MSDLAYSEIPYLTHGDVARGEVSGRLGLVDLMVGVYIFLAIILDATEYWFVASYWGYAVGLLFLFLLRPGQSHRIPELWLLMGLLLWGYIVVPLSEYASVALLGIWYLTRVLFMGLIVVVRCDSLKKMVFFLKMLILGAAVLAAAGVATGFQVATSGGERITGLTTQANAFGFVLLGGALAGLILFHFVGRLWRGVIFGCFGLTFVCLLASGSRGSALATFLAIVLYFLFEYLGNIRRNWRVFVPAALAVIAIPVLAMTVFRESPVVARLTAVEVGGETSTEARIYLYKEAWHVFLEHPFWGVGFGTYRFYSSAAVYTHTAPMELLASGGLPAFLLYYSVLTIVYIRLGRCVRLFRSDTALRRGMNAARASLLAIAFHGLFALAHQQKVDTILLAIIVGISARLLWVGQKAAALGQTYYEQEMLEPAAITSA